MRKILLLVWILSCVNLRAQTDSVSAPIPYFFLVQGGYSGLSMPNNSADPYMNPGYVFSVSMEAITKKHFYFSFGIQVSKTLEHELDCFYEYFNYSMMNPAHNYYSVSAITTGFSIPFKIGFSGLLYKDFGMGFHVGFTPIATWEHELIHHELNYYPGNTATYCNENSIMIKPLLNIGAELPFYIERSERMRFNFTPSIWYSHGVEDILIFYLQTGISISISGRNK